MFDHRLGKSPLAFGIDVRFAQIFGQAAQLPFIDRTFGNGGLQQIKDGPHPKVTTLVDDDESLDQLARKLFKRVMRKRAGIGIGLHQQRRLFHDQTDRAFAKYRSAIRPGQPHQKRVPFDEPDRTIISVDYCDQWAIGIAFEAMVNQLPRIVGAGRFEFNCHSP